MLSVPMPFITHVSVAAFFVSSLCHPYIEFGIFMDQTESW